MAEPRGTAAVRRLGFVLAVGGAVVAAGARRPSHPRPVGRAGRRPRHRSSRAQQYTRVDDDGDRRQYDYRSPAFDFEARLVYDRSGFVLDYPGIAARVL